MSVRVVAFGGGHGLYASLQALRRLDCDITAVVTVADDGGSSGRLRREFANLLPPGDLRQALVALASESHAHTAALWQHRFDGTGPLAGHTVGNLMLTGLFETYENPADALAHAGSMLGAVGRVVPMSTVPLEIEANVDGLGEAGTSGRGVVRGQAHVATTKEPVRRVQLLPEEPPACPEAVDAIAEADLLVYGPGSWFTSVVPHLLVPDLREAMHRSDARRLVILNLATDSETAGFSGVEHLHALVEHDEKFRCDMILADSSMNGDHVDVDRAAKSIGGRVVVASVAEAPGVARHNPSVVAEVLAQHIYA